MEVGSMTDKRVDQANVYAKMSAEPTDSVPVENVDGSLKAVKTNKAAVQAEANPWRALTVDNNTLSQSKVAKILNEKFDNSIEGLVKQANVDGKDLGTYTPAELAGEIEGTYIVNAK